MLSIVHEIVYLLLYSQFCREFERFATGTLEQFEKKTKNISFAILFRTCDRFNMSPVQMAIEFDCKNFISHPTVQHLMTQYFDDASFWRTVFDNLTIGLFHKYIKPEEHGEKFVSPLLKFSYFKIPSNNLFFVI